MNDFGYITRKRRKPSGVGRTRIKLAAMLQEHWPDYDIDPAKLRRNNPRFASAEYDCCSWDGNFSRRDGNQGAMLHIYSWDSMATIVESGGFDTDDRERFDVEISAK